MHASNKHSVNLADKLKDTDTGIGIISNIYKCTENSSNGKSIQLVMTSVDSSCTGTSTDNSSTGLHTI